MRNVSGASLKPKQSEVLGIKQLKGENFILSVS